MLHYRAFDYRFTVSASEIIRNAGDNPVRRTMEADLRANNACMRVFKSSTIISGISIHLSSIDRV